MPRDVGRPPYVPTIEERHCVQVLATNRASVKIISRLLRLSKPTVRKAFKAELADARETVIAALGAVVVNAALEGDWRAALSWLSRFGGPEWRKTETRLHSGLDGALPIEVNAKARVVIVPADPVDRLAAAAAAEAAAASVIGPV